MHNGVRALAMMAWAVGLGAASGTALAGDCEVWAAKVVSKQGQVEFRSAESEPWQPAELNQTLCDGDSLHVGDTARAAVQLPSETVMRLSGGTTLTFTATAERESSLLDLLEGAIHAITRVPRSLEVRTPFVNAAVEGTEFLVAADGEETFVSVFEGRVAMENGQGRILLAQGESGAAAENAAPAKRLVADPRDAVRWTLYFPPVGDLAGAGGSDALRKASERFAAGDVEGSLAAVSGTPPAGDAAADFHAYRASLNLYLGRLDAARADIDAALEADAGNGTGLALQAVAALAQNDNAKAMASAREAVARAPDAPAPHIALSYVHQAGFALEKALAEAGKAAKLAPDNALARARVAELELAVGDLDAAQAAAEKAVELNPNLARTQTVLGYAYLVRLRADPARKHFERAIEQDSSDPLSRLGLGLARIREGDLEAGRQEIEIAASLDPSESLVRSYLGKAYYEEKRNELAASQYAMAKALDPQDPTPWFYDAILKQTTNRPVEALEDMQAAVERNDNRAVYRSKLALDSDLAARSAAQARIYKDLGFDQLAMNEGSAALAADPSEWAAHRFLADAYAGQPRQDITRASALLQSQLLQPVNVTPLQPQLAETNLPIVEGSGPSKAGLSELNPMYVSDGVSVQADGVAGSNNTWGNDLVVAGLYGPFSISAGQFHYETDGFRENNDLTEDIYDVLAQWAVTPKLNVQVEFRRRESDQGDLDMNFDPEDFSTENRLEVEQDTSRLGLHFEVSNRSDLLVSFIDSQRDFTQRLVDQVPSVEEDTNNSGRQAEAQYLYRADRWNVTTGISAYDAEIDATSLLDWTDAFGVVCPPSPPFPPVPCTLSDESDADHRTGYLYLNVNAPAEMLWTLGVAYDELELAELDVNETNPKLGLQWALTPRLTFRAAYFETLQRTLVVKQSIEPVQVAGFNQFFDQNNGTLSEDYGLALDATFGQETYAGIELRRRDLDIPVPTQAPVPYVDRDERFARVYGYWTPDPRWALSLEVGYVGIEDGTGQGPEQLKTTTVPLGLRHFFSSSVFAGLTTTYIRQEVDNPAAGITDEREDFTLVDLGVGYRLPRRFGTVSLNVYNLFDEDFRYQDLNYLTPEPVVSPYIPERTVYGRLSLNF